MSAQIPDILVHNKIEYALITTTNGEFVFSPKIYKKRAYRASTACHRGYYCCYKATDNLLKLDKLFINCNPDTSKEINGKCLLRNEKTGKPVISEEGLYIYNDLGVVYENYSGRIRCGKEFITRYGRRIGFQPYYAYRELKELIFSRGKLVATKDHSDLAEKVRSSFEKAIVDNGLEDDAWLYRSTGGLITKYYEDLSDDQMKEYWWVKRRTTGA